MIRRRAETVPEPGDDVEAEPLGVGYADDEPKGGSDLFAGVAAVLWVPDPEQRHGWREVYVRALGDRPKPGRAMGFRKPGAP